MRRLVPLFLFALLAVPSAAEAKTHWLNAYEPDAKRYIGPLRTEKLDREDPYIATVRGTFSVFATTHYNTRPCNVMESRPTYKSPGVRNGRVNSDAEFLFANANCAGTDPAVGQRFQIAVGSKYKDFAPFGRGVLTAPHPSHRYDYALLGKGRKAGFRIPESFGGDNYGRLRIDIRRARQSDCTKGFASFGYADATQCATAVATARS